MGYKRKMLCMAAITMLITISLAAIVLNDDNSGGNWAGHSHSHGHANALGAGLKDQAYFDDNEYIPITSGAEFNMIGKSAGYPADGKYYLTDNITVAGGYSFRGVGTYEEPFTGIFDGNGFTISGGDVTIMGGTYIPTMPFSLSLFSYVAGQAEIHNLGSVNNMFGIFAVSAYTYVGGIIGYVFKDADVIVTNSYHIGPSSAAYAASGMHVAAGGIIAISYGNSVTIDGCYNNSYYYTDARGYDAYAGGLIGYCEGDLTISNSYNKSTVHSATSNSSSVGGLVGYMTDGALVITNSYNTGTVYIPAPDSTANPKDVAGGLVGQKLGGTMTISQSYNGGKVTAYSKSTPVAAGGIVGAVSPYNDHSGVYDITDCYNVGTVKAISTGNNSHAGGILGFTKNEQDVTITNCYSAGPIGAFGDSDEDSYAGGMIGNGVLATLLNCYFLELSVNKNGTYNNDICGKIAELRLDGGDWGDDARDDEHGSGSGPKTSAQLAADLTAVRLGETIYYIDDTDAYGGTFKGWDFDHIWTITEGVNNGYPVFGISPIGECTCTICDCCGGYVGENCGHIYCETPACICCTCGEVCCKCCLCNTGGDHVCPTVPDHVCPVDPDHVCPPGDHVCPPAPDHTCPVDPDHVCPPVSGHVCAKGGHSDLWPFVLAALTLLALTFLALAYMRKDEIEIGKIGAMSHTGSQIAPEPWVKRRGVTLKAGEDFEYSYGENKDAGTGTVTISIGKSGKKITVNFEIVGKP